MRTAVLLIILGIVVGNNFLSLYGTILVLLPGNTVRQTGRPTVLHCTNTSSLSTTDEIRVQFVPGTGRHSSIVQYSRYKYRVLQVVLVHGILRTLLVLGTGYWYWYYSTVPVLTVGLID